MSRYAGTDKYTYPDSGVLINKADIRDQAALDAFEADATSVRLLELHEQPIDGKFDLEHLCAIHRHLFQDVYEWAGETRTIDISKGTSRFANWPLIDSYLGKQLAALTNEKFLRSLPPEQFIERLAHTMAEINATHPFREGNGRVQRAFCAQLADRAGYFIDFADVESDEMIGAMIASFHGDNQRLVALLNRITAILE